MITITVTASDRDSKGEALKGADGRAITRELLIPESTAEIDAAFGSLIELVQLGVRARKVDLQNEIRIQAKSNGHAKVKGGQLHAANFKL